MFTISASLMHAVSAVTLWQPAYWVFGGIKLTTALLSVGAAIAIPSILRGLVAITKTSAVSEARKEMIEKQNEELRAMNAEAHEHLERLRTLIDCLPMGAIAIDQHQHVLHVNDKYQRLYILDARGEPVVGAEFLDIARLNSTAVADPAAYMQRLQEIFARQEEALGDLVFLRDGRVLSRDAVPIFMNGAYHGHLILLHDATTAHRVNRTQSEFMSLASHQLRTPLTVLKWAYGRLTKSLEGKLNPAERAMLDEARNAANRMGSTIHTMLAISRVEAGTVHAEYSDMKLGQALYDIQASLREAFERKRQKVEIDCPPNILMETDPFVFREILTNLVGNAIKYTGDGGKVSIRGRKEGEGVIIDIIDTGCGIPEHQQHRIFEKFFRGENVVGDDTEGTGLGLYLVLLLTHMLHGQISFTSREGHGTTFTLAFPLSRGVETRENR